MGAYIYGLHDGNGVIRYVGRTNNPKRRLTEHRAESKYGLTKMARWVKSIGKTRLQIKVLAECDADQASAREIEYIVRYWGNLFNRYPS